jgi:hypothetical protein
VAGGIGGTLDQVQERWGAHDFEDVGYIGYNSILVGEAQIDTIIVAYYDNEGTVYEIDLVYVERPAELTEEEALAALVAEVTPLDGACEDEPLDDSGFGTEVYGYHSDALEELFSAEDYGAVGFEGDDGSYSYAVDPYADDYFEITVQLGTDSVVPPTPTQAPVPPTAVPPPPDPPTQEPTGPGPGCDPNYSNCVPLVNYDLDCPDIGHPVQVIGSDPHGLDRDNDGWGCELS